MNRAFVRGFFIFLLFITEVDYQRVDWSLGWAGFVRLSPVRLSSDRYAVSNHYNTKYLIV